MTKNWCVNFLRLGILEQGIKEKFWVMGYQYDSKKHASWWKSRCTSNWRRLEEIGEGDRLVAYLPRKEMRNPPRAPGYALFAVGKVIKP